ncbi:unnamed protein product [Closterium sp. Yama58-4]|nr:unnamed protein product [Closterium sp. Yama58-4]
MSITSTLERFEGSINAGQHRSPDPSTARRDTIGDDARPTTRQRRASPIRATRGVTAGERTRTPMVAGALAHELRQAGHAAQPGDVPDGFQQWADRLEFANGVVPSMETGWKVNSSYNSPMLAWTAHELTQCVPPWQAVVDYAINVLAYDTAVADMNFWVPPLLAERVVAQALGITDPGQRALLNDAKHTGWMTRRMQVWRNLRWEQGRAYTNVLHGVPYEGAANPRITVPAEPPRDADPCISAEQFSEVYKVGKATIGLCHTSCTCIFLSGVDLPNTYFDTM